MMKRSRILWLCSMAALALCAFSASAAQAKDMWVVEGKTLAVGAPPGHGKEVEIPMSAAEPLTFEVPAVHELIQCKKAELVGPGGTGHAYIWNEEPVPGEIIGRQEGLIKFLQCENLNKPSCTVGVSGTVNTGSISGTLVSENGVLKKIYDMVVQQKWSEKSPFYSTFEPIAGFTQTSPCSSAVISATGLAGEIFKGSEEFKTHTMKYLGKPACGLAPISEVVLPDGTLDKISMRVSATMPAEACVFFDVDLVSGEKWSVK
jgi:hypothetical protein